MSSHQNNNSLSNNQQRYIDYCNLIMQPLLPTGRLMQQQQSDEAFQETPRIASPSSSSNKKRVRWTEGEHRLFLIGVNKFGKGDWKSISRYMASKSAYKTPNQITSHAQKYYLRQEQKVKDRKSICDVWKNDSDIVPHQTSGLQPLNEIHSPHVTTLQQEFQQLQQLFHTNATNKFPQQVDRCEFSDNMMNPQHNDELKWLSPNVGMHQESQQTEQVFLSNNPTSNFPQQMDGYETIIVTDHDDNDFPHPQDMDIPTEDWIHIPNVKVQQLLKYQLPNNSPQEVASQQGQELSIKEVFNHVPQVSDYFNNLDWTHPLHAKLQQLLGIHVSVEQLATQLATLNNYGCY